MNPTSRLASHALTLFVLLGLGVVVFHRSGLKQQFSRIAPGSAGTSARQTSARQTAAHERSFRAEGVGLLDATSSKGPSGVGLRPSMTSDSGATAEPTSRVVSIDGHATEVGAFQGILQDAKLRSDFRIGALTIHGGDGDAIRLILRSKTAAASDDCTGTYVVHGGTGKFELATGKGSYHYAPIVPRQWETVSIALEGTICY